jgi:hypothetical protein
MSREVVVRLASFIAVALAMAAWETAAPRRRRIVSRVIRWPANLGILAFDTVLVRLLFAAIPLAIAPEPSKAGGSSSTQPPRSTMGTSASVLPLTEFYDSSSLRRTCTGCITP